MVFNYSIAETDWITEVASDRSLARSRRLEDYISVTVAAISVASSSCFPSMTVLALLTMSAMDVPRPLTLITLSFFVVVFFNTPYREI